jgi:hypothetical protein
VLHKKGRNRLSKKPILMVDKKKKRVTAFCTPPQCRGEKP